VPAEPRNWSNKRAAKSRRKTVVYGKSVDRVGGRTTGNVMLAQAAAERDLGTPAAPGS